MNAPAHESDPLASRKVLVALTGGIACYKIASLVSRLAQRQADVRVIMTQAATRFITPLTLQSLSGHRVLTDLWESDDHPDSQHIGLARWCELFILAPATANTLAAVAAGLTPELVSLVACALPRQTPAVFAPAMNADMWLNPITQRNVATVRETLGWRQVGPAEGWQACRTAGPGRMVEADEILAQAAELLRR